MLASLKVGPGCAVRPTGSPPLAGARFIFSPAAVVVWPSLRNDAVNAGTESHRYNSSGDHGYIG